MEVKKIKLTQNKSAFVDNEDFGWLSKYKWSVHKSGKRIYARGSVNGKVVYMHRLIKS